MNPKPCKIDGCGKPVKSRGWCSKHRQRWQKHGDPLGGADRYASPEESFLARSRPAGDGSECLLWMGALLPSGHGVIANTGGSRAVHRYAWERANGPIPAGALIDHACRVPRCVNVDHLRLADKSTNGANRTGAEQGRRHPLPRGVHPSLSKFYARIQVRGKSYYLGTYDTAEEASSAAERAREKMFGAYAGLGAPQPPRGRAGDDMAFD